MIGHKQEIIAQAIASGNSQAQAYKQAFPKTSDDSADSNSTRYLQQHPEVKSRVIQLIEKRADLTRDKALDVVAQGMQADSIGKYGKQVDYVARLESAKVLLKLYGELGDRDTKSLSLTQLNVNIVNEIPIDTLRALIAEVKSMEEHEEDITDGEVVRDRTDDTKQSASE